MWDKGVSTLVGLIAHGAREVRNFLADGQYFSVDILRQGIVLYELDDRPLAEPKPLSSSHALRVARQNFGDKLPSALSFLDTAQYLAGKNQSRHSAFELHQSIETAYSCLLLTLTNYSPPSHNLKFVRGLPRITTDGSSRHGLVNSTASRPGTTFSTKPM